MSAFDGNKVLQHLRLKWRSQTCPMCNGGPWHVDGTAFELRAFQGGNMVLGAGPIIPVIPVTCNNCGYTVLVNAIKAGVVSPSAQQSS